RRLSRRGLGAHGVARDEPPSRLYLRLCLLSDRPVFAPQSAYPALAWVHPATPRDARSSPSTRSPRVQLRHPPLGRAVRYVSQPGAERYAGGLWVRGWRSSPRRRHAPRARCRRAPSPSVGHMATVRASNFGVPVAIKEAFGSRRTVPLVPP